MKIIITVADGNVKLEFENLQEFYDFVNNEWLKLIGFIKKMDDMS